MNDLPQRQNEETALNRLAASRWLYTRAKLVFSASLLLSVAVPALLAFSVTRYSHLKPFVAAWGIFVALLNLFLERTQKDIVGRAALVQEKFDCDLFRLDWNRAKVGFEPTTEDITVDAGKFMRGHGVDKLRDWYPKEIAQLPLALARVICQRVNCTWERRLRYAYANVLLILLFVLAFVMLALGLTSIHNFTDFVLVVLAPLMPAVLLLIRLYFDHRDAGQTSERLAEASTTLFEMRSRMQSTRRISPKNLAPCKIKIYDRRRTAPLVFNWIYERLRSENEAAMSKGAEELVRDAQAALARSA